MPAESDANDIPKFDPRLMIEALDSSDDTYPAILEKHMVEEEERARRKDELLKARSIFRKVVDALIPA
jgi:hypothetical protein